MRLIGAHLYVGEAQKSVLKQSADYRTSGECHDNEHDQSTPATESAA
jgi:hypothetical protein